MYDSGGEKTVSQSAGFGSQISVASTRGKEGKKTVVGVGRVFDDA